MKKIGLLAPALILALSLTSCGSKTNNDLPDNNSTEPPVANDSGETTPTDSEKSEAAGEITRPPASAELSAEWNTFQFELEGEIFTLPIRYSELEAKGWVAENDKDMDNTLEAGNYILNYTTIVNNNKENSEISVQFANLSDKDLPLRECYVSGIQLFEYSTSKDTVLYFPGGFTMGSEKAEIEALYGEPSETQEFSNTVEWTYKDQIYASVILTFTKETGEIEKMRMSNIYLP